MGRSDRRSRKRRVVHMRGIRLIAMARTVIVVPGLRGSGASHWQSLWQAKHPDYVRVLQRDWAVPRLDEWAAALEDALRDRSDSIVLAHGYGCIAAASLFIRNAHPVSGAMLVAPRDPTDFGLGMDALGALDFPSVLVASRNDPDMPLERARDMSSRLGSHFVDAGEAGHIDATSGFGPWPRGERLLAKLIESVEARERELRVAVALGA